MANRVYISNSFAPVYARYWQIEKAIRLRCGEFKPTHKLTIENLIYHTSEESVYMEVTFLEAGRMPSGADWNGCLRYYYSYIDWIAYNKPSFGVNSEGDICNFIGLLINHQSGPLGEKNVVALHLDVLDDNSDGSDNDKSGPDDGDDDDDDDDYGIDLDGYSPDSDDWR